ncbi:uncharacterized [Tachysurus ichikawai]
MANTSTLEPVSNCCDHQSLMAALDVSHVFTSCSSDHLPTCLNTAPQKSSSENKLHVSAVEAFYFRFPQWLTRVNIFSPSSLACFVFNGLKAAGWSDHFTSCLKYKILKSLTLQIRHQQI